MKENIAENKFEDFVNEFHDRPLWGIREILCKNNILNVKGWFVTTEDNLSNILFEFSDNRDFIIPNIFPCENFVIKKFKFIDDKFKRNFEVAIKRKNSTFKLNLIKKDSLMPFHEYYSFYHDEREFENTPFPPRRLVEMVAGGYEPFIFKLNGYSTFKNLDKILENFTGKGFCGYRQILDWGCGCGRTTRYFAGKCGDNLITGVDIVGDLIDFCRTTYDFGKFSRIDLMPPTHFQNSSFDLVIGLSVFTHLDENVQFEWLSELKRITKHNGVLLLSVHNRTSLLYTGFMQKEDLCDEWRAGKLADAGKCNNLDGIIEHSSYYRNVFHSNEYIRREWSKYFDIIAIVPSVNARHQDVIVAINR